MKMRILKIEWEDSIPEKPPLFCSDKSREVSWFKDYIKSYNIVFNYVESNPRTMDDGSDRESEDDVNFEEDEIAKNLDGMIGNIVDYYVHHDDREAPRDEPCVLDYLVIEVLGTKFCAGFDEVKFTLRKCKEDKREVIVNVYKHMLEYSLPFIKEAYLETIKTINNNPHLSTKEQLETVSEVTNEYLADVYHRMCNPYSYVGQKRMVVPPKYNGRYKLFIDDDGEVLK